MWMTVGTGSHRIIWIPNADVDWQTGNLLTAFAMFTKATPIEMPVLAYAFGKSDIPSIEAGTDTVQYGAGFKRNVDYAVANGIKLELLCVPYYMQSQNVTANKTQAIAYQTAHPDNIRLTISSMYGWAPYAEDLSIIGSTGSYSQKVKRLQQMQDSCEVYFPTISTTRFDAYAGRFIDPTTGLVDSVLSVLAARNITDVYCWASNTWAQYPASTVYGILNPSRTWVDDNELRFHPIGYSYMRYDMQERNNPDWLKTAYVDTVGASSTTSSARRAVVNAKYLPYCIGLYKYVNGAIYGTSDGTAAVANRVAAQSTFQVGMFLPAMTFCGGSKLTWKNADHTASVTTRRAQVDSTRSVFLDTMKQLNAQKKMSDYIVDTYGTTGNRTFIWSWLSDVNWDRKNARPFPNSNVRRQ